MYFQVFTGVAGIGGSKGEGGGLLRGSKFFQFHAVFGKIWQNRMLVSRGGGGLEPHLGRSATGQVLAGLMREAWVNSEGCGSRSKGFSELAVPRGCQERAPPLGPIYFILMHFSTKILQIIDWNSVSASAQIVVPSPQLHASTRESDLPDGGSRIFLRWGTNSHVGVILQIFLLKTA